MAFELIFLIAGIFYVICMFLDSFFSVKGIKAGIAVEGNTLLNKIFGTDKETARDYVLYDAVELVALSAAGIVSLLYPAFYLGLWLSAGAYVGMGIKHLQGALAWHKLGVKF